MSLSLPAECSRHEVQQPRTPGHRSEHLTNGTIRRLVPPERNVRRPSRLATGTSGPRYRGAQTNIHTNRMQCSYEIVLLVAGYGNIAPKTFWGRIVCIAYAVVGIPLMLLTLANIGDAFAKFFRFFYTQV